MGLYTRKLRSRRLKKPHLSSLAKAGFTATSQEGRRLPQARTAARPSWSGRLFLLQRRSHSVPATRARGFGGADSPDRPDSTYFSKSVLNAATAFSRPSLSWLHALWHTLLQEFGMTLPGSLLNMSRLTGDG